MGDEIIIKNWLKANELDLSEGQISDLLSYIELIRKTSSAMNLVSKNDLPQLVERHLLDSLYVLKTYNIPLRAKAADLGSGAGFPGIPVAIARPDIQMYLIESRHRKSLFLKSIASKLGLANVIVIHDRWENLDMAFDIILSRASLNETDLMTRAIPRLNLDGALLYFAKYNNIKVFKK
jgi:16S rRNA (guanine527-N7)-methyltransferase